MSRKRPESRGAEARAAGSEGGAKRRVRRTPIEQNGHDGAKAKLFDLYSKDGYVNAFLHIRWWHASLEKVAELVPKSGTILDLGCGYGIMSNYLALESPGRKILGAEMSGRKVKYAKKGLPNVEILNQDITQLKLPPCDAILFLDVLHHLRSYREQEELLKYCIGLLSPKGMLLVKEINDKPRLKFLFARFIDNSLYPGDKFYFRTEPDMTALLKSLNLDVTFHPIHEGKPLSHVVYAARKK